MPDDVDASRAASDTRAVWVRQTAAVRALSLLVSALGAREVLPVKGIVTARTLYDDPAERPISDVDVRIEGPRRLDGVVAFARENGHGIKGRSHAYDNVVLDIEGVEIDVECYVGPPGLCGLTVRSMLERSTLSEDVFGFPCAIPEPHDHALLLAVNVFKDKLVAAAPWSVEDLVRLAATPSFRPDDLAARARECRSAAIVWIVADWLADRSVVWRRVRDALGPRPPRLLYVALYRWLSAHAPHALATRLLARAGSDDVVMRARALRRAFSFSRE